MLYTFIELPDETIISHSEILNLHGREQVRVYIETPDEKNCFNHAVYWLPEGKWEDVVGYTPEQLDYLKDFVESEKALIFEFAKHGGLEHASGL